MEKKKAIAIITARGGSKRIPKKNIRNFCGKPIMAYSIESALQSEIFDEVMVSTDSKEIAEIALKYGARVPFMRSDKTASDYATTADVLLEVIDEYKKRRIEFEYMSCLYPTAPFITPDKIKKGYDEIKKENVNMVMSVVSFSYPPQRAYRLADNGLLEMAEPENLNKRSQDLEKLYHDCGQLYFYDVKKFEELNGKIIEGINPVIIDEMEMQDIDNETDWKLAELKYKIMRGDLR